MMTNRPWAKRSRWITGIAVCASAVGLAALLGAAMTPPAAVPATAGALAPTDQENYVARRVSDIIAREHYRRAPARRSSFEFDSRPVSGCDRRRAQLLLRERHRRIREIPLPARRCDQGGRCRARVRDFPPLPATQPGTHELRHRVADEEAGFRHRRVVQFRSREGALARQCGGDERAVAQTRQERRAVAGHHRQDSGRRLPIFCASATSTLRSAWIRASRTMSSRRS